MVQVKAIIHGPVSPLTPLFAMYYLIFRFILQELKLSTSQFPMYTELKSFQRSTFQTVILVPPPNTPLPTLFVRNGVESVAMIISQPQP